MCLEIVMDLSKAMPLSEGLVLPKLNMFPADHPQRKQKPAPTEKCPGPDLSNNLYQGKFWTESISTHPSLFHLPLKADSLNPLQSYVVSTIEFIWKPNKFLATFVSHLFRRFEFDMEVIYLTLIYCHRVKHAMDLKRCIRFLRGWQDASEEPFFCGRRMFMGAIISASKFISDTKRTNRQWAHMAGVCPQETALASRKFLALIGYRLHVSSEEFSYMRKTVASLGRSKPRNKRISPRNVYSFLASYSDLPGFQRTEASIEAMSVY